MNAHAVSDLDLHHQRGRHPTQESLAKDLVLTLHIRKHVGYTWTTPVELACYRDDDLIDALDTLC